MRTWHLAILVVVSTACIPIGSREVVPAFDATVGSPDVGDVAPADSGAARADAAELSPDSGGAADVGSAASDAGSPAGDAGAAPVDAGSCGDGKCGSGEDCATCSADCPLCPLPGQVWVTDSLTRVPRTGTPGTRSAAAIAAPRNETESFQLVVRAPDGAALSGVNVTATDLVGPATIPASAVTLFREHYVTVTKASLNSPYPPGAWPDALVPLVDPDTGAPLPAGARFESAPFTVAAGSNQPLWVDLAVPRTAAAGVYRGALRVSAAGFLPREVPVELTVWDFTFPVRVSLQSSFNCCAGMAAAHGTTKSTAEFRALSIKYEALLHAHHVMQGYPMGSVPGVDAATGHINSTSALPALQAYVDAGLSTYRIPWWNDWPWTDPLGADRPQAKQYLTELAAFANSVQPSMLPASYIYAVDEPNDAAAYELVRQRAALIHEADARHRVLVTEQPWPSDPAWGTLDGAVDIWVPLFRYADDSRVAAKVAAGGTVWSYTALVQGPASLPHWLIDFPLAGFRAAPWLNALRGLKGLLYWDTVSWDSVGDDPWADPNTLPRTSAYNGEGSLLYPGTAIGYPGPVASLRLKALRDGIRDYEYLSLLRQAGRDAERAAIIAKVARSWTDWSQDPADYDAARRQAAAILEPLLP